MQRQRQLLHRALQHPATSVHASLQHTLTPTVGVGKYTMVALVDCSDASCDAAPCGAVCFLHTKKKLQREPNYCPG